VDPKNDGDTNAAAEVEKKGEHSLKHLQQLRIPNTVTLMHMVHITLSAARSVIWLWCRYDLMTATGAATPGQLHVVTATKF